MTDYGDFGTVLIDAPWPYGTSLPSFGKKEGDVWKRPGSLVPYSTMTLAQIAALPVGRVAAKSAHLYCWTTNFHLPYAFAIIKGWGFRYSTTIVWAKKPQGRKGFPNWPVWTEYLLFATRGKFPGRRVNRAITTNCYTFPRGKHSAKPPKFYDLIESVSPGPRAELFARGNRSGWSSWGNECVSNPAIATVMAEVLDSPSWQSLGLATPTSSRKISTSPSTS